MKQIACISLIIIALLLFSNFTALAGEKHNRQQSPFTVVGAGYALMYDGVNDYVDGGTDISFGTGDFTLEMWVRPEGTSGYMISKDVTGDNNNQFRVGLSAGRVYFMMSDASSNPQLWNFDAGDYYVVSPTIPSGTWTHVAAVRTGTWHGLYINGNLVSSYSTYATINHIGTSSMLFGTQTGSGGFFKGQIDDIRVWTAARTAQQIRESMHLRLVGTESNLAGYLRFDEGSDTTTVDAVTSHVDTLHNFNMDSTSGWLQSSAPLGVGTSFSRTAIWKSYWDFGGLMLMQDNGCDQFDNPVDITVTRIMNSPNVVATGSSRMLDDRYWVVDVFGTPGTYAIWLQFAVPAWFTNNGLGIESMYQLYRRESNADGAWTLDVSGAGFLIDTGIAFSCRPSLIQFMLGTNDPLPIQIASLTAVSIEGGKVQLDWTTVSEVNNYGFFVERRGANEATFIELPNSFVAGAGTTLEQHNYLWTDENVQAGTYYYRLRQVDLNGDVSYSHEIIVNSVLGVRDEVAPREFALKQNYPNPFNPVTVIKYAVPSSQYVSLKVYNVLGEVVATLVDGMQDAGYKSVEFDGTKLSSGVYVYRITAGSFSAVKKMLMMK